MNIETVHKKDFTHPYILFLHFHKICNKLCTEENILDNRQLFFSEMWNVNLLIDYDWFGGEKFKARLFSIRKSWFERFMLSNLYSVLLMLLYWTILQCKNFLHTFHSSFTFSSWYFFSELVKNRIKIYWLADFFNYSILLADILLKF